MARRASSSRKVLSEANLAALGADRLAALLMENAGPSLKRRLRLELAAEVGAPDLALELDKRLAALASSRTRVSWRKRPELLKEVEAIGRIVIDRLVPLDGRLGLDRLVAWFDLYPALESRVQDPRGELALVFDNAALELAEISSALDTDLSAPLLAEALSTRFAHWASWIGRGAAALSPELAMRLLRSLTEKGSSPTGRRALLARRLADRAGDLDAWIAALPEQDRTRPEIGAELAKRLAEAGRAAQARAALEASRPRPLGQGKWGRGAEPTPPEAWLTAEVRVLEAEGASGKADEARWALFGRTLAPDLLRELLAKLADFEDVEALDRAFVIAGRHPDLMKALDFLMNWPARREAAALILSRASELRGGFDGVPLWAGRLGWRFPDAALLLVRARACALIRLGAGFSDEVMGLIGEAEALAAAAGPELQPHPEFLGELQASAPAQARRR